MATAETQLNLAQSIKDVVEKLRKNGLERKTDQAIEKAVHEVNIVWQLFLQGHETLKDDTAYIAAYIMEDTAKLYNGILLEIKELQEKRAGGGSNPKPEGASGGFSGSGPRPNDDDDDWNPDDNVTNAYCSQLGRELSRHKFILEEIIGSIISDPAYRRSEKTCNRLITQMHEKWSLVSELINTISARDTEFSSKPYWKLERQYLTALECLEENLEILRQQSGIREVPENRNERVLGTNLPSIHIAKFDGGYSNWRTFKSLYENMVHRLDYPKASKLAVLKGYLVGEASKIVQHYDITDENYDTAWKVLCDRYDNRRLQVSAVLEKLLKQPAIQMLSAASIRSLHDVTSECLSSLNNLKIKTEDWDPLLHHLLLKKLDSATHGMYEQGLERPRELQDTVGLLRFLEGRFQALEILSSKVCSSRQNQTIEKKALVSVSSGQEIRCPMCGKSGHWIEACYRWLSMAERERYDQAKSLKLCIRCLRPGHNSRFCRSRCARCQGGHHMALHFKDGSTTSVGRTSDKSRSNDKEDKKEQSKSESSAKIAAAAVGEGSTSEGCVFLGTVVLKVKNKSGELIRCRALLDSGSQINLITEKLRRKLGISYRHDVCNLGGIGGCKTGADKRASMTISSIQSGYSTDIEAFIIQRITADIPSRDVPVEQWPIPSNINLADPSFNKPAVIDMLIGAELYTELLSIGQIRLGEGLPTLQNTRFGWIVMGKAVSAVCASNFCGVTLIGDDCNGAGLNQALEKFWKMEEVEEPVEKLTAREASVEEYFNDTVRRDAEGRFIVRLPFTDNRFAIGGTEGMAIRRFRAQEGRLLKFPAMYRQYWQFMDEYFKLGHMEKINKAELKSPFCFLPHHGVFRPESTTTKLRVVFDASAKGTENVSLNDVLAIGPKVQEDLFDILTRFRMHRYAITADIEKMYRQILVDPEDQNMQLIVWRFDPESEEDYYRLKTVTYGTTSASYLATRCLKKLADDNKSRFPLASKVTARDFYMDDLITGCEELKHAVRMRKELQEMMTSGGFNLRKWCSNEEKILNGLPLEYCEYHFNADEDQKQTITALGLSWLPNLDELHYRATYMESKEITKRRVISEASRIFDPLGLVNPTIVLVKIFIQRLWKLELHWDEALPLELYEIWKLYREMLFRLNQVRVPRYVSLPDSRKQLHVFSDASERAYGAAVYVHSVSEDGEIRVRLICAKSKVAPLKVQTLPRLELAGAKLAAELSKRVQRAVGIGSNQTFYWTDSKITLSWIQAESTSLKTFVANRVAVIQRITKVKNWRHVSGSSNPADLVSRGCVPEKLDQVWFEGPAFLKVPNWDWQDHESWSDTIDGTGERRQHIVLAAVPESHFVDEIHHGGSFTLLTRIVAWIYRFTRGRESITGNRLTLKEVKRARLVIIKRMQELYFWDELQRLRRGQPISVKSVLRAMDPFLDDDGVLRLTGREEKSHLTYEEKHPIIIPDKHPFTRLLLSQIHIDNFHAGPQALLAAVRQQYWVINGRGLARSTVHRCILCARAKPKLQQQIMGQLPAERVRPSRPFSNVGIDFCGPVTVHYKLIRGKRPTKAYICVMVCFATKAVHLEVVSDLTTVAFIGCLKRFVARRGVPAKIFSDNGTNFLGASNQLKELGELFKTKEHMDEVHRHCLNRGIEWKFIPPRSPHFGGLWEAAVKSMKLHLVKVMHSRQLTYEELCTAVTEIEAVLNSRPLTAMSSDPGDLTALTAGHFLIGAPLTAIPEKSGPSNSLASHWEAVQEIKKEFWKSWSSEYLKELQLKRKWPTVSSDIQPGQLVALHEDNSSPLNWKLGRILETYPSESDGHVRVVRVKTATGEYDRCIQKLSPLPLDLDKEVINDDGGNENKRPASEDDDVVFVSITRPPKKRVALQPVQAVRNHPGSNHSLPKLFTFVATCLLVLSPISAMKNKFNTSKFETNPGLYFEDVAGGNVVASKWKMMVYFNLERYWLEYEGYHGVLDKLGSLCEKIEQGAYCYEILNQFRHDLINIQETNKLIFAHQNYTLKRKRRGLLNFVGAWERFMYGTLDQNYADEMALTVEKIRNNEQHLLTLSRNQTSIIESTVNIMKKNQWDVERQFDRIDREISSLKRLSGELQLGGRFNSLGLHTSLIMASYGQMQRAILYVVTRTHRGTISTLILKPDQLAREVEKIKHELPVTLKVPGFGKRIDLLKLYRIMSVRSHITNKMLVFQVELPLILDRSFQIYQVVPVPLLVSGEFLVIHYKHKYIMVDEQYERYYPMSELEIHECREAELGNLLCIQKRPMIARQAHEVDCGFGLLIGQHGRTPENCHFGSYEYMQAWIQLRAVNTWIYSFAFGQTIDMACDGEMMNLFLNGSGMISMSEGCVIHQNHITIAAHASVNSAVRSDIIPKWNSNLYENITKVIGIRNASVKMTNHSKELRELGEQIAAIKIQQSLPDDISTGTIHRDAVYHFGAIYFILILGLLLGCYFIIRKYCAAGTNQPGGAIITNNFELKLRKFKGEENLES